MYWQHNTRVDIIANTMGVNRFAEIMQLLHYNDNNLIPAGNSEDYNKCYKIQPLVDTAVSCFIIDNPEGLMNAGVVLCTVL